MKPDWLAQLAPAHAPPPPGWWPPAPGWWGLAVLLVGIVALVYGLNRPAHRLRRAALRQLALLEQTTDHDDAQLARLLQDLLRRYAMARFGRETVAQLTGAAWVDFVVAHGGSGWAGDSGANLLRAAYGGEAPGERGRWFAGARGFLKGRA
jgi:hypothetical protein